MNRRISGAGGIGRAAILRSGESGNHVSDSQFTGNRSGDELAEIERAAMAMSQRAEVPRWFLLSLVAVIAAVFTSFNVAHWGLAPGLALLGIPCCIAHILLRQQRPKNRTPAKRSTKYMGWALAMVALVQASVWWIPASAWHVALKGVVLFLLLTFLVMWMSGAEMEARVAESHERAV